MDLKIRFATEKDVPLLVRFIKELAEFEKLNHEVVLTDSILRESLFGKNPAAEALVGEVGREPACFAIFFHNFSTFEGKRGLYLEDLFVRPEFRGKGFGKKILRFLAQLAVERDCRRFEWWVLDWNENAIEFYRRLGARGMETFTVYRMDRKAIEALANETHSETIPS